MTIHVTIRKNSEGTENKKPRRSGAFHLNHAGLLSLPKGIRWLSVKFVQVFSLDDINVMG